MHIHVSWLTALITLLSWIVTVGAVNLFYRSHPSAYGASMWTSVATPC